MSILQNIALSQDTIKTRWREPYVTAGLNQKAIAGDFRGIVAGFKVVQNSGYTVEIQADPVLGLSIANILDSSGTKYALTLIQVGSLFLDLILQAGTTVFIVLDAQYSVGSNSTAQLKVVDAAELGLNPDLVLIAKVAVPASPPIVTANINMGYRLSSGDSIPFEARPPINLLTNGAFEADTAGGAPLGWKMTVGSLNPFVDNTVSRTGTRSMRLFAVVPTVATVVSNPVPIREGQLLRVSVWLRSSGGSPIAGGTGVTVSVNWLDPTWASSSVAQIEGSFLGGGTTWVQWAGLLVVPSGASIAGARLLISYNTCSGTLYVDDGELVVREAEHLGQSPVFGGSNAVADEFHAHTSAGSSYGGGANWADGSTNPATTVEGQFDKILIDVGGSSGAAKVGFTPTTPVDLTGITRVDTALDTLDDLKAGINIANLFTLTNTFNAGIVGNSTGAINAAGGTFVSLAGTTGPGVHTTGSGTGPGIRAFGGGSTNSYGGHFSSNGPSGNGVLGEGSLPNGTGVFGAGIGTGFGVSGNSPGGGVNGFSSASFGVRGQGATNGVYGIGGVGASGVYGENTNVSGFGVAGRSTTVGGVAVLADNTGGGTGLSVSTVTTGEGVSISAAGARALNAANTHATAPTGRFANAGGGTGLIGLGGGAASTFLNGVGVAGGGSNVGGQFKGVGTSVLGALVSGSLPNGTGLEAFGYGTGVAIDAYMGDGNNSTTIIACNGHISMSGASPPSATGFQNKITAKNVCKAWALFRCNNTATCTLVDGFNVASVTVFGSVISVNFVNPAGLMGNANYSVTATPESFFANAWIAMPCPGGTLSPNSAFSASITLKQSNNNSLIDAAGALVNGLGIFVQVFGTQ